MSTEKKLTPMMRQYISLKKGNKSKILWFRLGDFYEMFGDDAIKASKILGITLTARNKGTANEVPMCGIPYHAAENYLAKLTRAGESVAICEQLTEAGKGIVERGIVRVVTPGTTISDSILDEKDNNYIVAVIPENWNKKNNIPSNLFALAVCDFTTGEFKVSKFTRETICEELLRLEVAEVVLHKDSDLATFLYDTNRNITHFSTFKNSYETLIKHFKVHNLEGFGIENKDMLIEAAGLLLNYLFDTQKVDLAHITSIRSYSTADNMILDDTTIRNLELIYTLRDGMKDGSLLKVIDRTATAMGARLLRRWLLRPLQNKDNIQARLQGVEEFYNNSTLRSELPYILKNINDIERLIGRISLNSCSPRDIKSLSDSLDSIPQIKEWLVENQIKIIKDINNNLGNHSILNDSIKKILKDELPTTLKAGGIIKDNVDLELDTLRNISNNGKALLVELANRESERSGISSLKVKFNNVFGYYIEISNTNKHLVPDNYIRKQTLVNAERYITPELKELEEKILSASEKIISIEKRIFEELRISIVKDVASIQKTAFAIAKLDILLSSAIVAKEKNYSKPEIVEETILEINEGRHPVIEDLTFEDAFVPNNTFLSKDENYTMLITGPNMAGKSTYLRQVAIITLLAHIGFFVPATNAKIGLTDRIFTRVGASDNLTKGQSTFMVEMQEAANILNNATEKSLIILDEIGRGTSTYDGVSIAWGILEYVHDKIKARTLFATHYHELIAVADSLPNACNWSVQVVEVKDLITGEGKITFLHKVKPGGVNRSYGIEVAKLAGLPNEIIIKANSILKNLEESVVEKGIEKTLKNTRSIDGQQELFAVQNIPEELKRVHKVLNEIDPLNLTPMQALAQLEMLKKIQNNE